MQFWAGTCKLVPHVKDDFQHAEASMQQQHLAAACGPIALKEHTYVESWKRNWLRYDECFTSALVHLCVHGRTLQT